MIMDCVYRHPALHCRGWFLPSRHHFRSQHSLTDQDQYLQSREINNILWYCSTQHTLSTGCHLQTNVLAEHFNQMITDNICKFCINTSVSHQFLHTIIPHALLFMFVCRNISAAATQHWRLAIRQVRSVEPCAWDIVQHIPLKRVGPLPWPLGSGLSWWASSWHPLGTPCQPWPTSGKACRLNLYLTSPTPACRCSCLEGEH